MAQDGHKPDLASRHDTAAPGAKIASRATPSRRSISGAYSLADASREEDDRVSHTQPIPGRGLDQLNELRRMPLAAMTVTADRRLVSANPSARRLLDLHLGLEMDDQHLRCTEPDFAPRFAKLISEAVSANQRRQQFHGAFELRRSGTRGWLDVIVASHPEQGSAYALVVARLRH